jgi:peroxiredoxin
MEGDWVNAPVLNQTKRKLSDPLKSGAKVVLFFNPELSDPFCTTKTTSFNTNKILSCLWKHLIFS